MNKLEEIITAIIIAAVSLIAVHDRTYSIEDIVNQDKNKPKAEEAKQDSTNIKPKKWYQFSNYLANAGFMFTNVSSYYGGRYQMNNSIFEGPLKDQFVISYDYVGKREAGEALKIDWKKVKEKRMLRVSYRVILKGKPFAEISYRSDGKFGIETTYVTGGLEKNISNSLIKIKFDGGFGYMMGRVAMEDQNYPMVTTSTQFETSQNYPASLKGRVIAYLPKTQLGRVIDAAGTLSFNVNAWGFKPGFGAKVTIDNMPVPGGYERIPRYEISFTLTKSDQKKEKK